MDYRPKVLQSKCENLNDSSHLTMDIVAFLPPELIEEIFSYLPVRDLIVCGAVSVSWRIAANNLCLWRKLEKNYERWLLPDSKVKRSDVITSNFPDKSRSLEAIMPKDNSSPFNPLKVFVCQRNFLKYNWRNGIYTDHCLVVKDTKRIRFYKVFYPSKSPYDCLYYPISRRHNFRTYDFYLIRLDAKPKIVGRLFTTEDPDSVRCISVMRDCVVWLYGRKVQYFSLNSELDKSEVLSIGILDLGGDDDNFEFPRFLTMDANNIVALSLSLKIWCKQNLSLKYVYNLHSESIPSACCLYDGQLIYAYEPHDNYDSTVIKMCNIRSGVSSPAEHEFSVNGPIEKMECNKRFIILHYCDNLQNKEFFQVRDIETCTINFSYCGSRYTLTIHNEGIVARNSTDSTIELMSYSTGEWHVMTQFKAELNFVFDNIAVFRSKTSQDFWDWVEKVKLYSIAVDRSDPDSFFIVHVSECWLVTTNLSGVYKIHGFG